MMRTLVATLMWFVPMASALAVQWTFESSVDVSPANDVAVSKVFHHLDSSGRRNIAVSARGVAVSWEDDRDGSPRVYLAYKRRDKAHFESEVQVSGGGEGYEPSLVALSESRFLIA